MSITVVSNVNELRDALSRAVANDTIKLRGYHYSGNFYIKTPNLTLCSENANIPALIGDYRPYKQGMEYFTIIVNADNVTLRDLNFRTPNCIALRINGNHCKLRYLNFEQVKIGLIASGAGLDFKNISVRRFSEDGMRLSSDGFNGRNITIENLYASNVEAHHDGIQFYAGDPNSPLRHKGRYEGKHAINKGKLRNVHIRSTTDISRGSIGQLQGIFSADGFMDGIQLEDIYIETNTIHGVSLRGMREAKDGTPSVLKNIVLRKIRGLSAGVTPEIKLLPARRLTSAGMSQFGIVATRSLTPSDVSSSPLVLDKKEENISEVLFPDESFRQSEEEIVQTRSLNGTVWECVPEGEIDTLQHREISYAATLLYNDATENKQFACATEKRQSNISIPVIPTEDEEEIEEFEEESKINRKIFFNVVRKKLFSGRLSSTQVKGMDVILDEWEKRGLDDARYLAYILATTFHETAYTMKPIKEYGRGRRKRYGQTYYGRGFVQITWKANYRKFSRLLGINLVKYPAKALKIDVATQILYEGMLKGLFTGRALRHYFKSNRSDWYNARRIVNGLDRANKIGRYGRTFWHAILTATGELTRALAAPKSVDAIIDNTEVVELKELSREFD